MLLPFFWLGTFATIFLFDAPFRNVADQILRNLILWCVISYPAVWTVALAFTIIALWRDWSSRYVVASAGIPFVIGAAPFLLAAILRHV
jgi:hypothetical protein